MHSQHFVHRSPGQIIVILVAALLLHHPFMANAQVRPEVSVGLLLGIPSGDFGDNVSETGVGIVLAGGIQLLSLAKTSSGLTDSMFKAFIAMDRESDFLLHITT